MKFFSVDGSTKTDDKTANITLEFPEHVNFVALSGFLNDMEITYNFHFEPVDGRVWRCVAERTNAQVTWIPSVRALGIQV